MKISYLELLEMIKEGKQPKKVKFEGTVYEWQFASFTDLKGNYFNSLITRKHTDDFLTREKCIEIVKEILTVEEKEYLSIVIRPFREKIKHLQKISCANGCYIRIDLEDDAMVFPYFEEDTRYKGMEEDKKYTLEELGL